MASSFACYLLEMGRKDLMHYVIAEEIYPTVFPLSSLEDEPDNTAIVQLVRIKHLTNKMLTKTADREGTRRNSTLESKLCT